MVGPGENPALPVSGLFVINPHPIMRSLLSVLFLSLLLAACSGTSRSLDGEIPPPPPVQNEFRAAWIASVANIDWPSRPGLSVDQQQEELRAMLDRLVDLNMNAAIFQVRPATDAFYQSDLEPWSEYLTGQMGRAPEPFYDPLEFAIEEAHARGIELHAWINPFRARHSSARSEISEDHVSVRRPEIVVEYGTHLWLDPGLPEARQHSLDVVLDMVRRYDLDGVHIDDYFYPYRERDADGELIEFPDSASYARAVREGETRNIDDWRRHNVDRFVESMYRAVKEEKPQVKVGISPFGIWRPGFPEEVTGFDAYQEIYADARLWLNEGWVDYFSPQLYWPIDREGQRYPVLLEWWVGENTHNRHMWPGNFTSRVESGSGQNNWSISELRRQIELTRAQEGAGGNIHFSMRAFMQPRGGLADTLMTGVYAQPAVIPPSPWLGDAPARPSLTVERSGDEGRVILRSEGDRPFTWLVQTYDGNVWHTDILPGAATSIEVGPRAQRVEVRAINRTNQLSAPAVADL